MSFPTYDSYKDSGVEYLGKVPEGWEMKRLKYLADVRLSNIDKHFVEGQQSVMLCNYLDVYKNDRITSSIDFMRSTASDEQIQRLSVFFGDVIITKDSEEPSDIGIPAIIDESISGLVCGYHLALIRPMKSTGGFLRYLFNGRYVRSVFEAEATGITRYALGKYAIENVTVAAPPLPEQYSIAYFLDRETAKIDALIAEQQRLIVLLKEKRQTVISQAVTKGVNPNAQMKDSGIEWLGKVPEAWTITRLGNLFREVNESGNDELPLLTVSIHSGISDRELDDSELDRKVMRSDDRSKYKRVLPGDLVYNMMRAWQGGFGTTTVEGMVSPAYVVARPREPMTTSYIELLLRTPQAIEQMRRHSRGVTDFRLRLYWDEFKNIKVAMPPKTEADAICSHIAKNDAEFSEIIKANQESITLLQERRTALISAAVTGKIDVRSLAEKDAA